MEPFIAKRLPIEYGLDKDLLKLIAEANEKYGEYRSLLNSMEFDSKFFLDSILLSESLKSTQIEGTQISQDEMYYLKYMEKTDDNLEIQNLKKTIEYANNELLKKKKIDLNLINNMHKILMDSVRSSDKTPGQLRTTQNWISPKGIGIEGAVFIPPIPEDVPILLDNLFQYMNDEFIDPLFINLAISHSQFETIYAYKDGNGRLGRALIPIQLAMLNDEKPILFLSEIIELYKLSYQRFLNESRKGNMIGFIKFFLQCIIEQCNAYIFKIKQIQIIYKEDLKTVGQIKGSSVYKILFAIAKQIVFTKKEIEQESGVSKNIVSNIINKLVELNIIVKDETFNKKGYKYKRIYDVFVGKNFN